MPLKDINKANPMLTEYWMQIDATGMTSVGWPDKKAATNIRSQMSTLRSLAARQAPTLYDITKDIQLTVRLHSPDNWVIEGRKPQQLGQPASTPPARVLTPDLPVYHAEEHHHNPIQVTHTGIPMQMHEVMPAQLTEEQRKEIERVEERQRNEALLKSLGFDRPPQRNE